MIIRASTNCELAKIKHERIHLIFDSRREDCIKSKLEFLNDIDLFKGWEAMHLNRVASVLKTVMYIYISSSIFTFTSSSYYYYRFAPAAYIATQGELPEDMFFVISGHILIQREVVIHQKHTAPTSAHSWETKYYKSSRIVNVGDILPGQYFGESALLMNEPRFAHCISAGITQVLALNRSDFLLLAHGKTFDV